MTRPLSPKELLALQLAAADPEGRMVVIDPGDGPLTVLAPAGQPDLELGEAGLDNLLAHSLLRRSRETSFLLTEGGWRRAGRPGPPTD